MTLRHFKIFIAVCDRMNMTSAAKALFISQSAVSQAVSELEHYYGVRIFERISRKLYLTQAGERLLSYARHMVRMSVEAENEMKTLQENGSLRIGASVTVGAHVLPKLVSEFQRNYEKTEILVFEDNTEKIEKKVLEDGIDIGLVEGEVQSPDLIKKSFMKDELAVIFSPGHRFAQMIEIPPEELEKEKFIVREKGSGTRKLFEKVMSANELMWKPVWICNNADTIKMAVREGLGISVISKRAAAGEIMSGILCQAEVSGIQFKRQFKIIYHKNKYISKSMEQFMERCLASVDSCEKLW
jgi:DNA-binding transcriptional LysR family regulator